MYNRYLYILSHICICCDDMDDTRYSVSDIILKLLSMNDDILVACHNSNIVIVIGPLLNLLFTYINSSCCFSFRNHLIWEKTVPRMDLNIPKLTGFVYITVFTHWHPLCILHPLPHFSSSLEVFRNEFYLKIICQVLSLSMKLLINALIVCNRYGSWKRISWEKPLIIISTSDYS